MPMLALTACSIVKNEDTSLAVTTEPNVSQCLPRGSVHVTFVPDQTKSKVQMKSELFSLALEKARPYGGDTVVPAGPMESGGQFFNAYRCRDLRTTEPPVLGIELEKQL